MLNGFAMESKGFAFRLKLGCERKDICKAFDLSNQRSALIETKQSEPMDLDELGALIQAHQGSNTCYFKTQMTQIDMEAHVCNPNT